MKYGYARIWCITLNLVNLIQAILTINEKNTEKAVLFGRIYLVISLILAVLILISYKHTKIIPLIMSILFMRNAANLLDLEHHREVIGDTNWLILIGSSSTCSYQTWSILTQLSESMTVNIIISLVATIIAAVFMAISGHFSQFSEDIASIYGVTFILTASVSVFIILAQRR